MKFSANAGKLAGALALVALPLDDSCVRKIASLGAVRLDVRAGANRIAVRSNILDLAIDVLATGSGEIEETGEVALPGERLAALVAAIAPGQMVTVASTDRTATITAGRSRYRLPILPLDQLPEPLRPEATLREVEITRDDALRLFSYPLFAASTEQTRYYLNGIFLQTVGDTLAAVATDGHRLCELTMPASGLSVDRRLIIPLTSVKIIIKILRSTKSDTAVTLRRSPTLFELHTGDVSFISKLIDAEYPAYERLVPPVAANNVTANRTELMQATARLAAVAADTEQKMRVVGLCWGVEESGLRLALANDVGEDVIEAEVSGAGKTAVQIQHLAELLDELEGERISFNVNSHGDAILVRDPDDASLTVLQMPCRF